jgi:hypothetical protein
VRTQSNVRADSRGERGRGGGGGGGEGGRERGGRKRGGEGDASVRTPMSLRMLGCVRADMGVRADALVSARTRVFYLLVTSKRTLQYVQVMDAAAAIV